MVGKLHFYSADSSEKRYVHVILAFISVCLAYALASITKATAIQIPWWVDAPAVFGFYGLIYTLFDKYLWQLHSIRKILRLKIPMISGNYSGSLSSSHDKFKKKTKITANIQQSWDKILIQIETNQSKSHSLSASFHVSDRISPVLIYYYENTPFVSSVKTMHAHKGLAELHVKSDGLNGEFFTGRDRITFGRFVLSKNQS
ncbi:MAG: hypothetical protein ACOY5B_05460 [Spirochaetota bacterium]